MAAQHALALYGCDEPQPQRWPLRAGALACELVGGRFGPVRANGHEVWHGLAFLFRDAGWGTPEPVLALHEQRSDEQGQHFFWQGHIACSGEDVAGPGVPDARIELALQVTASPDGALHLRARATPTHDLLANRCGWVLLHPLSAAGAAIEVEHVDGRCSRSTLPEEVPAWPPFTGVRTLRHEYAPGHWAQAQLPGEDHELEDQRNNADASFKTYSRSNMMPRPYVLRRGLTLEREVHLCLLGEPAPPPVSHHAGPPRWSLPTAVTGTVRLGLAITPDMARAASPAELAQLRLWRPAFLHLTLWPGTPASHIDWRGVRTLLDAAGASLRLDLCGWNELGEGTAQDRDCQALALTLQQWGVAPAQVAALPCGPRAASHLRHCFAGAAIGGGTPHFFAQLNRLEGSGGEDFMAFTVCPTVHGAADEDVMHGLQSLPSMLVTARRRHPGRSWHLGPDNLPARASPLGRQPAGDGCRRIALAVRDPRTQGLFGAAWLLGHLAAALRAQVQALTLPALSGPDGLGLVTDSTPSGWQATPAAAWLDICLGWSCVQVLDEVDVPVRNKTFANWPLVALIGQSPRGWQVLLANLGAETQVFPWTHGGHWSCLDAEAWVSHRQWPCSSPWRMMGNCSDAMQLGPYALACINLFTPPEADHAP